MHDETLIQVAITVPDEVLEHHFGGSEQSAYEYFLYDLVKAKDALVKDYANHYAEEWLERRENGE